MDKLFVYGTLLGKFDNEFAVQLKKESIVFAKGFVKGHLYQISYYPGLVLENDGIQVFGEILQLTSPEKTFSWLDTYEGAEKGNPDPDYERIITEVFLNNGSHIQAWTYNYLKSPPPGGLIKSGRWDEVNP